MLGFLQDPEKLKLLMMGAGLLSHDPRQPANFGQDLQRGLLGGMQVDQMSAERQRQKQQDELHQMRLAQAKREEAQQQGLMDLAQRSQREVMPGDGMGPPSLQFDPQAFMQGLPAIDPMMALRMMPKPQGPVRLGAGDRLVDPTSGKELVSPTPEKPKTPMLGQTREIKSGGKILTYEWDGNRWNKIADAPQFKPEGPEKPEKAPQGFRWADNGSRLEPIPGGPADSKAGKDAEALAKREKGALERADFVLSKVKEAKEGAKKMLTTGMVGGVMRNIPGSDAYNLNRVLDPIKANIGFAELQAMREASPTGGALGQVAVQELNMLQSVLGSLDNAQSEEQLLGALDSIEKHFNNWKRAVQAAKRGEGKNGGATVVDWNDLP